MAMQRRRRSEVRHLMQLAVLSAALTVVVVLVLRSDAWHQIWSAYNS